MSKYGHRTMNWFEAIVNKIGGEEEADAFLLGELVVSRTTRVWETWKTIMIGTFKNVDEIRTVLKAEGHFIGKYADIILGKPAFKVSEKEQIVELVNVSVKELGFKKDSRYEDICNRAFELGLGLCPAEVGPQLRLQYKDQPKNTLIVVAMEAIIDSDNNPDVVFGLRCNDDGGQHLNADGGYSDRTWSNDVHFVFLRRKNIQN